MTLRTTVLAVAIAGLTTVAAIAEPQAPRGVRLRYWRDEGREPVLIGWGTTADEIVAKFPPTVLEGSPRKRDGTFLTLATVTCDTRPDGHGRCSFSTADWMTDFGEGAPFAFTTPSLDCTSGGSTSTRCCSTPEPSTSWQTC